MRRPPGFVPLMILLSIAAVVVLIPVTCQAIQSNDGDGRFGEGPPGSPSPTVKASPTIQRQPGVTTRPPRQARSTPTRAPGVVVTGGQLPPLPAGACAGAVTAARPRNGTSSLVAASPGLLALLNPEYGFENANPMGDDILEIWIRYNCFEVQVRIPDDNNVVLHRIQLRQGDTYPLSCDGRGYGLDSLVSAFQQALDVFDSLPPGESPVPVIVNSSPFTLTCVKA